METKEALQSTKALQSAEETALQRYQWITPLLVLDGILKGTATA